MYIESAHIIRKMSTAIAEKPRKGLTPGFTCVRGRLTLEEKRKIEKAEIATGRKRKELIRAAIRWLPSVDYPISKTEKEGEFTEDIKIEVLPREKAIVQTIAKTNEVSISDVLRWIINNFDWIAKEI